MLNLLHPYNPEWKNEFNRLREILLKVLEGNRVDIQHIGSTSVPGLIAKPILDIDIILEDKNHLYAVSEKLEKAGYVARGEQGIVGRFAFRQSTASVPFISSHKTWQEHHLYVCYADSLALKNHLLFRDALLKDNNLANEYAQLKMKLVQEAGMTRELYTNRKTEFITEVLSTLGFNRDEVSGIIQANQ